MMSLVKRLALLALERTRLADVIAKLEIDRQTPRFRMYYDLARNAGSSHQHAMRYAKYRVRIRT